MSPDEPDLIAALRHSGVFVNGHHVVVLVDLVVQAQRLPQEADLTAHRHFCGRPEEGSGGQSESRAGLEHCQRSHKARRHLLRLSAAGHGQENREKFGNGKPDFQVLDKF